MMTANKTSAIAGQRPERLDQLDILRALAAMSVFAHHVYGSIFSWSFYPPGDLYEHLSRHSRWVLLLLPAQFGWIGVPLFFVLSGFCIHYAHAVRDRPLNYGQFLFRRFWRLYPAYLVAMAVFIWQGHHLGGQYTWFDILTHLTMLHNVWQSTFFGINGSFWSLAAEWQFYMVYPLFLWLAARAGVGRAFLVSLLLAMPLLISFMFGWTQNPNWLRSPLTSWCQWCLGAWVAERFVRGEKRIIPLWSPVILLPVGIVVQLRSSIVFDSAALLWSVFWAWIIEGAVRRDFRASAKILPLVWFGQISYSFYLFHQPVIKYIFEAPGFFSLSQPRTKVLLALVMVLPALICISAASYWLIERPGVLIGKKLLAIGFLRKRPVEIAPANQPITQT